MAKQFSELSEAHTAFIQRQKIFFTASAAAGTRVNISPRGTDALRILGPNQVAYRDLTGSGNETAAHMLADGRLTIMFCAFDGPPLILRLYGTGRILAPGGGAFETVLAEHFAGEAPLGTRHIVALDVDLVQTSCGYGVPLFDYDGERPSLANWAEAKGEDGLLAYRREKNAVSMDGLPTGLVDRAPRTRLSPFPLGEKVRQGDEGGAKRRAVEATSHPHPPAGTFSRQREKG